MKLDRLVRSLRDACDLVDELTRKQVFLNISGTRPDASDAMGRLMIELLTMDRTRAGRRASSRSCH